jgi:1-acyl-sn-glycerol-3-phosphate acyltransferase
MMLRIYVVRLIKGKDLQRALRYRKQFLGWLFPAMGIKVEVYGTPSREPCILMSNHRSYFDPAPVLEEVWAVPVAMAELRKWPVIGLGVDLSGVVFVDRSSAEGRQAARDTINRRLASGFSILIYPEGGINPGPELGELKQGMFKDAADQGYAIQAVAIEYRHAEDTWLDGSFVNHFYSRFGQKDMTIRVSYGPMIQSDDPNRLVTEYTAWIEQEVDRLRKGWFIEGTEHSR